MTERSMAERLARAQSMVDHAWPIYNGAPDEPEARASLVRDTLSAVFPESVLSLRESDVAALEAAASAARRSRVHLFRLRREDDARYAAEPSDATGLTAWGALVAARQASDWLKLIEQLVGSLRRYRVVRGPAAGPLSRRLVAQRFARRCAAELGIATPAVRWLRPVDEGGDLVTLGEMAGCAPKGNKSVIFVRSDIRSERELLRVVAHEVAHQSGAPEEYALAYELAAVRRHVPPELPTPPLLAEVGS